MIGLSLEKLVEAPCVHRECLGASLTAEEKEAFFEEAFTGAYA